MNPNNIGFERLKGRENFSEWKVGAKAYLTSKGHFKECIVKLATEATAVMKSANEKALAELTLLLDTSLYSYIEHATENDCQSLFKMLRDWQKNNKILRINSNIIYNNKWHQKQLYKYQVWAIGFSFFVFSTQRVVYIAHDVMKCAAVVFKFMEAKKYKHSIYLCERLLLMLNALLEYISFSFYRPNV